MTNYQCLSPRQSSSAVERNMQVYHCGKFAGFLMEHEKYPCLMCWWWLHVSWIMFEINESDEEYDGMLILVVRVSELCM